MPVLQEVVQLSTDKKSNAVKLMLAIAADLSSSERDVVLSELSALQKADSVVELYRKITEFKDMGRSIAWNSSGPTGLLPSGVSTDTCPWCKRRLD